MRVIFLVRHGVIDYQQLTLSAEGRTYATRLPDLLGAPPKIDFLGTDEEARCVETITPLAQRYGLTPKRYAKPNFLTMLPLLDAPREGVSVICYRVEAVNGLLVALGFPPWNANTRDSSYEQILKYQDEGNTVSRTYIQTGQQRPRR